jgi:hypothetical protein
MQLPGGVWQDLERKRSFSFAPITGQLAFNIAEITEQGGKIPETIDQVLNVALRELAGEAATLSRVATLCIGDRQFLMRELLLRFGDSQKWYSLKCCECEQIFDFEIDLVKLPVYEGSKDYPFVKILLRGSEAVFRLPNGSDQVLLTNCPAVQAQTSILINCLQADSVQTDVAVFIAGLSDTEKEKIEAAMDAASPAVVTDVQATCLDCKSDNRLYIDPYELLQRGYGDLLAQVHRIATSYHWSEQQILALAIHRREHYLKMIEADRGMIQ